MLSIIMLIDVLNGFYAECPIFHCVADCRYAECPCIPCNYTECGCVDSHCAECHYAECCCVQCNYTECGYAECRQAKCISAQCRYAVMLSVSIMIVSMTKLAPKIFFTLTQLDFCRKLIRFQGLLGSVF